jgi:hypothetical protein
MATVTRNGGAMLRLTRLAGDEATGFGMTNVDAAGADGSAASARSGADVRAALLVWASSFFPMLRLVEIRLPPARE